MTSYVEYSSNNSGGYWWLEDDHWHALEKAGWKIVWAHLTYFYTDEGDYVREEDGTPKLVPLAEGNSKWGVGLGVKDGRYMGALAKTAFKPGATDLREAAREWESATGMSSTDAGCACCGQPHNFTLYQNGKFIESGPSASYEAHW